MCHVFKIIDLPFERQFLKFCSFLCDKFYIITSKLAVLCREFNLYDKFNNGNNLVIVVVKARSDACNFTTLIL